MRRFWQGSTDHRGPPERPGRVVTVVPADPEVWCWGRAYEVSPDEQAGVLARLDHRESGGYERIDTDIEVLPDDEASLIRAGRILRGVFYVAPQTNANFLGPAPLPALAEQIAAAHGPSGPNPEYLFELAESLRAMRAEDAHVFELEAAVRDQLRARPPAPLPESRRRSE